MSAPDLLDHLRDATSAASQFQAGERLVLAVSGGPDSVALLDLLQRLAPERGLRLHVAHLDHMLREEGVEDAAWVSQIAAERSIPCSIDAVNVRRLAGQHGWGLEQASRHARYAFLARVAARQGAGSVAVAHQADDQAETVLMNVLRGTGLAGLSGMANSSGFPLSEAEIRAIDDPDPIPNGLAWPPRLVRPLLDLPRERLLEYLRWREIPYREDESNQDSTFLRNRLRHQVVPQLEAINPRLTEALRRLAKASRVDEAFIAQAADAAWNELAAAPSPNRRELGRQAFLSLHPALQRRLLRRAFSELGAALRDAGWEHVEAARAAIEAGAGAADLPGNLRLDVRVDQIQLAALDRGAASDTSTVDDSGSAEPSPRRGGLAVSLPPPGPRPLEVPGETRWGEGWRIRTELGERRAGEPASGHSPWRATLDASVVGSQPSLRARREGDRIQPLGMGGRHKSLQDLFVDERIPQHLRARWPVVVAGEGDQLLWVPGLRLDDRARVRAETHSVYRLEVIPPPGLLD